MGREADIVFESWWWLKSFDDLGGIAADHYIVRVGTSYHSSCGDGAVYYQEIWSDSLSSWRGCSGRLTVADRARANDDGSASNPALQKEVETSVNKYWNGS